ncbi:uncharacterized protein SCHCODRAFT_01199804 [Schizophyllum commune H4-8]|uniref:uncharacterized protein n=1 Tax=Schizophyllum commune (strain H4-8 / FGSC 9210) TaxID=578458 RepID=UPI00215ECCAF|nr:uncharacterized protein SCHCODRAFT_01199804 [Schizophyllum commune H4-8]KAI5896248.1 hypothetical protein SCHCODRAFT_01199804 [Schizophyllum commune H4-8]
MLRQSLRVFVLLVLIIVVVDISYAAPMSAESNVCGDTEGNYVDKRVLIGLVIGILFVAAFVTALCIAGCPSFCRHHSCARGSARGDVEENCYDGQEVSMFTSVCGVPDIAVSSITGNPCPPYAQVAVPAPSVAISSVVECQSGGA